MKLPIIFQKSEMPNHTANRQKRNKPFEEAQIEKCSVKPVLQKDMIKITQRN